jgi:hypothetical protein
MDQEERLKAALADRYRGEREIGIVGIQPRSVNEIEVRGETLGSVRRPFLKQKVATWTSINESWSVEEIP